MICTGFPVAFYSLCRWQTAASAFAFEPGKQIIKQSDILRADLVINLLRGRIVIDVRGLIACVEQGDPGGFVVDQSIGERLPHGCLGAVQFGKILLQQEFPRRFPRELTGELKALDDAVPHDFRGCLLIGLHAFAQPRHSVLEVLQFGPVSIH